MIRTLTARRIGAARMRARLAAAEAVAEVSAAPACAAGRAVAESGEPCCLRVGVLSARVEDGAEFLSEVTPCARYVYRRSGGQMIRPRGRSRGALKPRRCRCPVAVFVCGH